MAALPARRQDLHSVRHHRDHVAVRQPALQLRLHQLNCVKQPRDGSGVSSVAVDGRANVNYWPSPPTRTRARSQCRPAPGPPRRSLSAGCRDVEESFPARCPAWRTTPAVPDVPNQISRCNPSFDVRKSWVSPCQSSGVSGRPSRSHHCAIRCKGSKAWESPTDNCAATWRASAAVSISISAVSRFATHRAPATVAARLHKRHQDGKHP